VILRNLENLLTMSSTIWRQWMFNCVREREEGERKRMGESYLSIYNAWKTMPKWAIAHDSPAREQRVARKFITGLTSSGLFWSCLCLGIEASILDPTLPYFASSKGRMKSPAKSKNTYGHIDCLRCTRNKMWDRGTFLEDWELYTRRLRRYPVIVVNSFKIY
jgi:hypothetical protein